MKTLSSHEPLYVAPNFCHCCGSDDFAGPFWTEWGTAAGVEFWVCANCDVPMGVEVPQWWPTHPWRKN